MGSREIKKEEKYVNYILQRVNFPNEKHDLDEMEMYPCGRSRKKRIHCESSLVSKSHCIFVRTSDGLVIHAEQSYTKVYVNGKQQRKCKLRHGDIVGIGTQENESTDRNCFIFRVLTVKRDTPLNDFDEAQSEENDSSREDAGVKRKSTSPDLNQAQRKISKKNEKELGELSDSDCQIISDEEGTDVPPGNIDNATRSNCGETFNRENCNGVFSSSNVIPQMQGSEFTLDRNEPSSTTRENCCTNGDLGDSDEEIMEVPINPIQLPTGEMVTLALNTASLPVKQEYIDDSEMANANARENEATAEEVTSTTSNVKESRRKETVQNIPEEDLENWKLEDLLRAWKEIKQADEEMPRLDEGDRPVNVVSSHVEDCSQNATVNASSNLSSLENPFELPEKQREMMNSGQVIECEDSTKAKQCENKTTTELFGHLNVNVANENSYNAVRTREESLAACNDFPITSRDDYFDNELNDSFYDHDQSASHSLSEEYESNANTSRAILNEPQTNLVQTLERSEDSWGIPSDSRMQQADLASDTFEVSLANRNYKHYSGKSKFTENSRGVMLLADQLKGVSKNRPSSGQHESQATPLANQQLDAVNSSMRTSFDSNNVEPRQSCHTSTSKRSQFYDKRVDKPCAKSAVTPTKPMGSQQQGADQFGNLTIREAKMQNLRQNKNTDVESGVRLVTLDEFLNSILKWDPEWIEKVHRNSRFFPKIFNCDWTEVQENKTNYETYKSYYETFSRLHLMEIWKQITTDAAEPSSKTKYKCSIVEKSITTRAVSGLRDNLFCMKLEMVFRRSSHSNHLNVGDLFRIDVRLNDREPELWIFGYVESSEVFSIKPQTRFNRELLNEGNGALSIFEVVIQSYRFDQFKPKHRFDRFKANQVYELQRLTYLRPHLRIIQALQALPQSELMTDILSPSISSYNLDSSHDREPDWWKNYPLISKMQLNKEQMNSVASVTDVVHKGLPKICLIQGPPGTGKSMVIISLIQQILFGENSTNNDNPTTVLLCAQSNTAIDELVIKLKKIRESSRKEHQFSMVRIGTEDNINPKVKSFTLSRLADKNSRSTFDTCLTMEIQKKNSLEQRMSELRQKLLTLASDHPSHGPLLIEYTDTQIQHNNIVNKIESKKNKLRTKDKSKIEESILTNANIIACTLSSCSPDSMKAIYGNGKLKTISVCIVDEATQSCEAETLMPLVLGVKVLILVGDPNQLPATVCSQRAKQYHLDKSLFTRIRDNFDLESNAMIKTPVMFLNIQYRMAKEIAYWPNNYFYQSKLKNHPVDSAGLNLKPYVLLNINDTQDEDNGYLNTQEADFVANVVEMVVGLVDFNSRSLSIGIITPYNKQKLILAEKIRQVMKHLGGKACEKLTWTVNTIDSFQGQECDVVIMSCVRSRGIGFLADEERLCVALTRARFSLIMCGNFQTFEKQKMWQSLLDDSEKRKVKQDFSYNASFEDIRRAISK